MATIASGSGNQAPPLEGYDLYGENRPLVEAVAREGAGWAGEALRGLGELLGGEPLEWGRLANEHPPQLRTHDRFGNRIDEVEFHPAWHRLLGLGVEHALHAAPWREPRARHTSRARRRRRLGTDTSRFGWNHGLVCVVADRLSTMLDTHEA